MSTPGQLRPEPPPMRRSAKVALVLLGTTGVVGVAAAIDTWIKSRDRDGPAPAPQPTVPSISTAQTYANNDFIPGVGYYHAPYHGWFPFPFNHHDPARGYFGGGLWQLAPFAATLLRSQPSNDAVATALANRRFLEQLEQQQRQAQSTSSGYRSNFAGGTSGGSVAPTRPSSSPPPSSGSRSIQRGGFGSSGHSSGGSS
jgi:hypothetical protein